MSTFFEVIKSRFDADSQLATDGFSELFQGHATGGEDKPYCVLDTESETHSSHSFRAKFEAGAFTLVAVAASKELAKTYRDHIVDVFRDAEKELTVTGLSVILLHITNTTYEEVEPDLWEARVEYEYSYAEAR